MHGIWYDILFTYIMEVQLAWPPQASTEPAHINFSICFPLISSPPILAAILCSFCTGAQEYQFCKLDPLSR